MATVWTWIDWYLKKIVFKVKLKKNERCFEDKIKFIHDVKWNCLVSLFSWCKENCIEEVDELIDFFGALENLKVWPLLSL